MHPQKQLITLARSLSKIKSSSKVYELICTHLLDLVPCHGISIAILQENKTTADIMLASNQAGWQQLKSCSIEATFLANVRNADEPTRVEDATTHTAHEIQTLGDNGCQSVFSFPIIVNDEAVGTLNIGYQQSDALLPEAEARIWHINSLLSSSIERIELQAQLTEKAKHSQEQITELQQLNKLSIALSQISDIEQAVELPIKAALKMLRGDRASFTIYDEKTNTLNVLGTDSPKTIGPKTMVFELHNSVVGQAFQSGIIQTWDPLTKTDLVDIVLMRKSGLQAGLIVPLFVNGKVTVTLNVGRLNATSFNQKDYLVAQQIGTMLASTLERQRLLDNFADNLRKTEYQASRLNVLNALALDLTESTGWTEAFNITCKTLIELIPSARASMTQINDAQTHWEVFNGVGDEKKKPGKVKLKGSHLEKMVKEKVTLYSGDIRNSPFKLLREISNLGIRSIMQAPLISQGRVIGTLNISSDEVDAYDEYDKILIGQAAVLLSRTLENLRLFEKVESALVDAHRTSDELALINSLISQSVKAKTFQESLDIIANCLFQILGIAKVGIALLDDAKENLVVVSEYFEPGTSISTVGLKIPFKGNTLNESVVYGKQRVFLDDVQNTAEDLELRELMREQGNHAIAILPLIVAGEVIGTVGLGIWDPDVSISIQTLDLMENILSQAAASIYNLQLLDQQKIALSEIRSQQRELRLVNEVVSNSQFILMRWIKFNNQWKPEYISSNCIQFGYDSEDFLNDPELSFSIILDKDKPKVRKEFGKYLAEKVDNFIREYRVITKSGDIRWVEDRVNLERDKAGKVITLQSILVDRTEQKLTGKRLRLTQFSVDNTPRIQFWLDIAGKFVFVNQAAFQSLGYTKEEMLELDIFQIDMTASVEGFTNNWNYLRENNE
ncbi:MAG: GAF domain-containing protein, partial [Anaerolineae bacterium]